MHVFKKQVQLHEKCRPQRKDIVARSILVQRTLYDVWTTIEIFSVQKKLS